MGEKKELTPIKKELLISSHVVFDIVYSPHETMLIQEAKLKNCKIIYGINMLIFQGIQQFKLWTGLDAPYDKIKEKLEQEIS